MKKHENNAFKLLIVPVKLLSAVTCMMFGNQFRLWGDIMLNHLHMLLCVHFLELNFM